MGKELLLNYKRAEYAEGSIADIAYDIDAAVCGVIEIEEGWTSDPLLWCACNICLMYQPCHLRCIVGPCTLKYLLVHTYVTYVGLFPLGSRSSNQSCLAGFGAWRIEGYSAHRLDQHRVQSIPWCMERRTA